MNPILVLYRGDLTLTNNLNSLHVLFLIYTAGTVGRIERVKFLAQTGLRSRASLFPVIQVELFGSAILPVTRGHCLPLSDGYYMCQVLTEL